MKMEAQEYLSKIKNISFNVIRKKKLLLEDVKDEEEFRSLTDELLEQIFYDEREHDNFYREKGSIPIIEKEYENLTRFSLQVLEFFNLYRQLKNY